MNVRLISLFAAVIPAALFLTGCGTATYTDSKGTGTIVSLDQIDIQDWNRAADELVASLLASGVLERAPEQPAVMAVSRIVNNTMQQVDTDSLIKKIRIELNRSGKTITTTTLGFGGRVEDPLAKEVAELQARQSGQKRNLTLPYYTLSGKLLEDRARAGSTRQVTYTFQLALTTVKDGLAVWEDEKQISKIGKKPAVGF